MEATRSASRQDILLSHRPRLRWLVLAVLPVLLVALMSAFGYHASLSQTALQETGTPPPPGSLVTTGQWRLTPLRQEVDALLTDPRARSRVLAGAPDGIWMSANGGQSWRRQRGSPPSGVVALAANGPGTLFVAGADNGRVYTWDGRATHHWQPVSPVLAGGNPVFSLAVTPSGSPTVLAGSVGGVYRGTLAGRHWTWSKVADSGQSAVAALTWLPWQHETAFAAVFGSAPALLRSTDGGRTWRPYTHGLPSTIPAQALLPITVPHRAVVLTTMGTGVWMLRSDDTWHDISGDLPYRHGMPLAANRRQTQIFTGTMGWGVFGTLTQSIQWQRLGRQLNGASYTVLSLALVKSNQRYLLAGTAEGVYRYLL